LPRRKSLSASKYYTRRPVSLPTPDRTLYEPSLRFALPGGRVRSARDAPRVLRVQWAKRGSRRGILVVLAIRRWKGISIPPHDFRIFSLIVTRFSQKRMNRSSHASKLRSFIRDGLREQIANGERIFSHARVRTFNV